MEVYTVNTFIVVLIALVMSSTWSFAGIFAPSVMTLSAPVEIEYQFDGTALSIPFTVGGAPAAVWFVINTYGKASEIVGVRNGFLGWHYVNKIDTTVYVSQRYQREVGSTSISWDGNDQDGNAVTAGTYSYYLWAYDDKSSRQLASSFVMIGFDWDCQFAHIYEKGEDGLSLSNPLFVGAQSWWMPGRKGQFYKWQMGGDPNDIANYQMTTVPLYAANEAYVYGGAVFDPRDYSIFYHCLQTGWGGSQQAMLKYTFVADGEAIQDEDWLGMDEAWDYSGIGYQGPGSYTDRNYIYTLSTGLHQYGEEWNKLICTSFEGEIIFSKMMHDWYMPDDPNPHGYVNGSPHLAYSRVPYHWFLLAHTSCMHQMIDTTRLVVDPDDESDMVIFSNSNGDYWMDSAYSPDVEPAWYCLADDKTISMRRDSIAIDRNGFNVMGTSYFGLTSFGVSTQDGTGIGYMQFADDTISDDWDVKGGGLLCDSQSSYDGLYYSGAMSPTEDWTTALRASTWFVASDSVGGIITNEPVAVEEDSQTLFTVNQNLPNPFNPTTTINFSIPADDHVTVEVFNVAGQKVDTLVNDFMGAGKHSVVWDASGLSAGVYFYTVKSGEFSKTIKMTLLK